MFPGMQNIFQRTRPAAAGIADPAIFNVPGGRARARERRAKMSGVIQVVRRLPESTVNENHNRMRSRPRGHPEIAKLKRIFAVRNPRIGPGRRQRQNVLTCRGCGGGCGK